MTSSEKPSAEGLWDEALDGSASSKDRDDSGWAGCREIVVGSTFFWLLATIVTCSDVTVGDMTAFVICGFGFLLAVFWFFWTLALFVDPGDRRARGEVGQWTFVFSSGLFGLMLMVTDLDACLRLKLSEPALRRCLAEPRPNGSVTFPGHFGRWIGLFCFESIQDQGSGVEFKSTSSYPHGGLIYCPTGRPQRISGDHRYSHLTGPWWRFEHRY